MSDVLAPAGWYPDPAGGGGQRYWDGAAWTQHVAPPTAAAAPVQPPAWTPPARTRGPVWPWVLGIGLGAVFVLAILAAIAIPTFLGAKERVNDRAAQTAARKAAIAVAVLQNDRPDRTDIPSAELARLEPSLHFTTGPSYGPTDASYAIGQGLVSVAVRSRSGSCWVVRRLGATTQTGSLAKGRPCEAAAAVIQMIPEEF